MIKKMTRKILTAIASVFIFASLLNASPVSINGKLKVNGLQLVNSCGNTVQLRGVSTHGIQWFGGCYTDATLDYVANVMNADFVRIALYVEQNGYVSNPDYYTSMVDTLVDKIGARGMYAMIDWHVLYVAGQSSGDPNTQIVGARTFWQHEAAQHKDKPYVLYEICNEPSPSRLTTTWAMVKTYADDIIPKIRAIDPNTVIICGTPNWSQLGSEVVASQLNYANIMYAFHFYAGTHNTGMLTPYLGTLPIFCTEWGPSDSSGNGGDNYTVAQDFINIMGGANTAAVKISWAEWSLADNTDSSSLLASGSCNNGPYALSTAGAFVKKNIMTPGRTFVACEPTEVQSPTATITGTPPTATMTSTITLTPTITMTMTPYPFDLIYDGDTLGATLADGVAVSNVEHNAAEPTPMGTISQTTGGNGGNGMRLAYINPAYWQAHQWTFPAKTVGEYNNIMLDVKAVSGSVTKLLYRPDNTVPGASIVDLALAAGGINTTWRTVLIPLNRLYTAVPAAIDTLKFGDNTLNNYTVMIDNVKLVMVPSATPTPTFTETQTFTVSPTITQTYTVTPTHTVSPTASPTPTIVPNLEFKEHFTYPNPSTGDKIVFRYLHDGYVDAVRIKVFSYSDRKIAEITDTNKYGLPSVSETEWIPAWRLGNGLYYYVIELTGRDKTVAKKMGALVVLRQLQ